jgi:hypothetical protein
MNMRTFQIGLTLLALLVAPPATLTAQTLQAPVAYTEPLTPGMRDALTVLYQATHRRGERP